MSVVDEILEYFPDNLRKQLNFIDDVQEIRVRANKNVCIVKNSKNIQLDVVVTFNDIEEIFYNICERSIHTYQDEINNGFITLKNGCRVGIAGTAVVEKDNIISIKNITSLNFRVAFDRIGCSECISKLIYNNLLIAGPPNSGKTTFLRDIARKLSVDKKVCIIDERNEISGVNNCFNKNNMIDCLIGYKKSYGISLAIRTLSPQFIIFDEIGSFEECQGVCDSLNSGIKVITTVHCYDKKEFLSRPICNLLLKSNCFEYVVFLSEQAGEVSMVYKIKGDELCEYLEY